MPPHCDSLDGPVVTAARQALEAGDVDLGPETRETADRLLFETVVRIHRAGEGAPYTGLKPAGLDVGPVSHRLHLVEELEGRRADSVEDARSYVEAMLGFEVYSHHLYQAMRSSEHHEGAAHAH